MRRRSLSGSLMQDLCLILALWLVACVIFHAIRNHETAYEWLNLELHKYGDPELAPKSGAIDVGNRSVGPLGDASPSPIPR